MSRIEACFSSLRMAGRKALIPYIAAGDPDLDATLELMQALTSLGANIIELGYPFSDPTSDGPVIQMAVERALASQTSLKKVLQLVAEFRAQNAHTPVVLMGYANPIERMGYRRFADAAAVSGVDGVLVVDLPPEESADFRELLAAVGIDAIFLVAPTTDEKRAKEICRLGRGYIYYVSLKGVTGASHLELASVAENLKRLRTYTKLPLGVGFGIKDAEDAKRVAAIADAVVVGSALVEKIARLDAGRRYSQRQLKREVSLIGAMREAMDAG